MVRTVVAYALAGLSVAAGCGSTPAAERSASPETCPDRAAYATDEADNSGASWSPDGRSIAFSSTRSGRSESYVLDAATCAVRRVTQNGGTDPD
jgi:dipeptidyl aminopeptidase/acylaminoacyl peptidase